jgi:hypothetical protein
MVADRVVNGIQSILPAEWQGHGMATFNDSSSRASVLTSHSIRRREPFRMLLLFSHL